MNAGFIVSKKWLLFILRMAVTIITLAIIIKTIHLKDIFAVFKNPQNPTCILFAFVLLIPNLYLQWYRWHFLLSLIKADTSVGDSFCSLFGGMVVGFITPGRIGEVGRSLFLKNIDRIRGSGLVFIDRIYHLASILTCGIIGLVCMLGYMFCFEYYILIPIMLIAILVILCVLLVSLNPHWIRGFIYNITLILDFRDIMKRFISSMDSFNKKNAKKLMILSYCLYMVYMSQYCLLALAFQPIPILKIAWATTSSFLAKTLLPIAVADLGVREGTAIYFFMKLQIDKITAFNSSILLFLINILIPTLFGLFFIPRMGEKENPS